MKDKVQQAIPDLNVDVGVRLDKTAPDHWDIIQG